MGGKEQICTVLVMYTYLCAELISDGELSPAGRHGHQTRFQTVRIWTEKYWIK